MSNFKLSIIVFLLAAALLGWISYVYKEPVAKNSGGHLRFGKGELTQNVSASRPQWEGTERKYDLGFPYMLLPHEKRKVSGFRWKPPGKVKVEGWRE